MKPETWGGHLRAERLARGLHQRDVAEILGSDLETLKRWERGYQSPRVSWREPIVAFLGYEPEGK